MLLWQQKFRPIGDSCIACNSPLACSDKLCFYGDYSAHISVSLYHVSCFNGDRRLLDWVVFFKSCDYGDRPKSFIHISQNLLTKGQK